MKIITCYPKSIALKKLELKTFQFLRSSVYVASNFPELARSAGDQCYLLNSSKKLPVVDIDFESFFDLQFAKYRYRFHVGTIIRSDYSQVTYYLAVCEFDKNNTRFMIRRKYHFDYDENGQQNNHPIFHLQYAGEITPGLQEEYTDHYEDIMFPQICEPRLFYPPMTLSLILNQLFREFRCDITIKIIGDDLWKGIIKENEEIVLKPYFALCKSFFDTHHNASRLFTRDFSYGD